ncbi:MAG: uncharacterized protein JWO51_966 [Rhodospirillales bacterium]|nr:uncharacterized protein [Rhodospirillales bacterium]
MSAIGEALAALKKVILLEDRISSQGKKLEQLATIVVDIDKRMAAMEGRLEGFMAAASAFGGGGRPAKVIDPDRSLGGPKEA